VRQLDPSASFVVVATTASFASPWLVVAFGAFELKQLLLRWLEKFLLLERLE
jgi:hypothetical protein